MIDHKNLNQPFPKSLCHRCQNIKLVPGKNSVFLQCNDKRIKYAPQPVKACQLFLKK